MYDAGYYAPIETQTRKRPGSRDQALLARQLLEDGAPAGIRIIEPRSRGRTSASIVYLARQALISDVLRRPEIFGLGAYDGALKGVSFMLTDDQVAYTQRRAILAAAFTHQDQAAFATDFNMDEIANELAGSVARNLASMNAVRGEIDIIRAYGNLVPYLLIERVFGLSGRAKPSGLVQLLQLAKWLTSKRRLHPGHVTQPMYSLHAEASVILGHVFANFEGRSKWTHAAARAALQSACSQIQADMQAARERPSQTLLSHLLALQAEFVPSAMSLDAFEAHLLSILFEFSSTMQMLVSAGFARMIALMQERGGSFAEIIELMRDKTTSDVFIYEALRLKPVTATLMRRVLMDTEIAGAPVKQGEYVACMVAESGMDPHAYSDPSNINMTRDPQLYLQWGPYGGQHACFGQRWSRAILRQMFLNLNLLPGLDFIAGNRGKQRQLAGLPESQLVSFRAGISTLNRSE